MYSTIPCSGHLPNIEFSIDNVITFKPSFSRGTPSVHVVGNQQVERERKKEGKKERKTGERQDRTGKERDGTGQESERERERGRGRRTWRKGAKGKDSERKK